MHAPRTALSWLLSRGLLRWLVAIGTGAVSASCAAGGDYSGAVDATGTPTDESGSVGVGDDSGLDIDAPNAPDFSLACTQDLSAQAFDQKKPVARVLYSWTTPEQEAELRATPQLLTRGETPGLGHGRAMDLLLERANGEQGSTLEKAVAAQFSLVRYAWTNPWATRLGWPGEDYGDRLIRIELREEAWIGELSELGQILQVRDLDGRMIPPDEVALSPERIAALFFVLRSDTGPLTCGVGTWGGLSGSGGYREFIVGNENMIERWSLGTQEIAQRLKDDVVALRAFMDANANHFSTAAESFNRQVSCTWAGEFASTCYVDALSMPSDLYQPTRPRLVHLIETLSAPFVIQPLVVEPEKG